jgi:hypothetical protein
MTKSEALFKVLFLIGRARALKKHKDKPRLLRKLGYLFNMIHSHRSTPNYYTTCVKEANLAFNKLLNNKRR